MSAEKHGRSSGFFGARSRRASLSILAFTLGVVTASADDGRLSRGADPSATLAARNPAVVTEADLQGALKNAEKLYRTYKKARDRAADRYERVRDKHGRNLEDDLRQNVLAPDACNRIESRLRLMKDALEAHDLPAAQAAIDEIGVQLTEEANRYQAVAYVTDIQVRKAGDFSDGDRHLHRVLPHA